MSAATDDPNSGPGGDGVGAVADHVTLRNGVRVLLRPMDPSDDERLLRFHRTLSDETTRRRFFAVHPRLTPHEVHHFTHVDHRDREALVGVHDGEIIGVGRFDRIDEGTDAEVAFVVSDAWQRQGLATTFFSRLARLAMARGLRRFVAETLPDNHPMLHVFRNSGFPLHERLGYAVVDITIDLVPP